MIDECGEINMLNLRMFLRLLLVFFVVSLLFAFASVAYAFDPDTNLSNADASFWGEDIGDSSGYSVTMAGDVNGDGYDDFLVGAYGDDDGGSNAGQTYLILGKASGWTMDTDLSAADASFWGEDYHDESGFSVATAGDVNGDGSDDFLIGAYGDDDGGTGAGQTYLLLGTPLLGTPPQVAGGEVYPINKLSILAPWIGLIAAFTGVVYALRKLQNSRVRLD